MENGKCVQSSKIEDQCTKHRDTDLLCYRKDGILDWHCRPGLYVNSTNRDLCEVDFCQQATLEKSEDLRDQIRSVCGANVDQCNTNIVKHPVTGETYYKFTCKCADGYIEDPGTGLCKLNDVCNEEGVQECAKQNLECRRKFAIVKEKDKSGKLVDRVIPQSRCACPPGETFDTDANQCVPQCDLKENM